MSFEGKTCLVIGAASNLGLAVSREFAKRGAKTVLACRDRERGEEAVSEIRRSAPQALLDVFTCDLASLKSVRAFLEEFRAKYPSLDILYNNAAVMKRRRTATEDGFETMFQVNYLAQFMIMNSLLDQLKNAAEPQIINNGRPADKYRLDLIDLQFTRKYGMYNSFFLTKLYLLFASLELSRRPERGNVTVMMVDPGPFKSDLVRDIPLMGWLKNLFSAPVEKAAENILFHAGASDISVKNGKVFKEKEEYPLSEYWKDENLARKLWERTAALMGS